MKYLIIGNGVAGIQAAETLREIDTTSTIIMVSKENTIPYSRPLISYIVSGELEDREIFIRPEDYYEKLKIETYLGKTVRNVDVENRKVFLESGESIGWDRLLIATGADPRVMKVDGSDLGNIFFLRNLDDAVNIVKSCDSGARKAIVLGGGLVGFKAAYGLLKRGIDVSILITSPYPLSQVADTRSGQLIRKTLEDYGLAVEVGKSVKAFEGRDGKVCGALLNDGQRVDCDLVVVGKGVDPAISFLKDSGVNINRGILVDENLRSSVPDIYAAGDVAEAPDIVWRDNRVNAIWPVAAEQGRVAAYNMLGIERRYQGSLGRNVIRIFDLDFMAGGIINPPDEDRYEVLSVYNEKEKKYKKLVFEEDRLVGMVLVNCVEQGGVLLNLIAQRRNLSSRKKELLDREDYYSMLRSYR